MCVITPIFVDGKLFGFTGSIAHKSDIGGPVPGSCSGQARETFNEGLHLPAVRYQHNGVTSGEVDRIIGANSRTPELVLGDIRGQVGSGRLGEQRLLELVQQIRQGQDRGLLRAPVRTVRAAPARRRRRMEGRPFRSRAPGRRRRHRARKRRCACMWSWRRKATASISISAAPPTRPRARRISARRWRRPPPPMC